ncbi:MAG: 16S rRNA (guanine(966)-N(2))-methyltransferase RsmD [Crocinitomicaceae bacterium]
MRVVSGKYRGKRFYPPKKFPSRPTTDFAKEGLFNILNNQLNWEEVVVLDLFAGTGAIGLECLSRGAKSVLSIEKHPVAIRHLNKIRENFPDEDWRILKKDVFAFIAENSGPYDLILADPPFDMEGVEKLPDLIFQSSLLSKNGVLVLEHSKKESFKTNERWIDERNYGGVSFSFFRHEMK